MFLRRVDEYCAILSVSYSVDFLDVGVVVSSMRGQGQGWQYHTIKILNMCSSINKFITILLIYLSSENLL